MYQWIGGDQLKDLAKEVEKIVDAGYTALKMDATKRMYYTDTQNAVTEIVDRVERVRQTVDDVDIYVDFRGRVSKAMASRVVEVIAPFGVTFVEEPLLPENNEYLPNIAQNSTVPPATGDRLYSRWDFKPLFEDGAVDVVQLDVSHAGGISEVVRIANMAEAHDISIAPNCPLGPIALASSL